MNISVTRLAGWSALLKVLVLIADAAVIVLLVIFRQPVTIAGDMFAIVRGLLTLPIILALALLLPPYAAPRARFWAWFGGLGYLGGIALRIMLLAHLIPSQDGVKALLGASFMEVGWLLYMNWEMWRVALLKGALPWIGIAYGLVSLLTILPIVYPSALIRIGVTLTVVILEAIWTVWLGILLIRDKVSAYA